MKILVLGAGSIGGYYGGRLAQAGADVTFLVRPRRAAQLQQNGLVITSAYGNFSGQVKTISQDQLKPDWDLILLTSKAFDLDSAIEAIRPAVGPDTAILPLLNGIAHIERLNKEFGKERVLGGLAKIVVTLTAEGVIAHLNDWNYITFGEQNGEMSARVKYLQSAFPEESVKAKAVPDIMQHMWEKIVHLSSVAGATCLMRASVGEIAQVPGGTELMLHFLNTNAAIAGLEGYPISADFIAEYTRLFNDVSSKYVPSILRDIERKNAIEGEHILGFMKDKADAHGLDASIHRLTWMQLKAYEIRRATNRLTEG
ncbi:ketopantoate reductase family protein [Herbaspirillum autotrophicum]|uniref:ketopantoate reductase family protein n=1 Tax=Herbaspirillum autotrophicum TaxID=180195 RepID=UPI00067A7A80|nr:ketopantoate reductase family protein [Herbaspirillum autotrophicum]